MNTAKTLDTIGPIDYGVDVTTLPFWVPSVDNFYVSKENRLHDRLVHLAEDENGRVRDVAWLTISPRNDGNAYNTAIDVDGVSEDSTTRNAWNDIYEVVPSEYWPSTIYQHGPCEQTDVEDFIEQLILEDASERIEYDIESDVDFDDPDEEYFAGQVEQAGETYLSLPSHYDDDRAAAVTAKFHALFDARVAKLRAEAKAKWAK